MSRSFGDLDLKSDNPEWIISQPEIVEESLKPGDQFFILASDGIWDVISNLEAVTIVKNAFECNNLTPTEVAQTLVRIAEERRWYARDDITALVVRL